MGDSNMRFHTTWLLFSALSLGVLLQACEPDTPIAVEDMGGMGDGGPKDTGVDSCIVVECAAPPVGCNYEGGDPCTSCGTLVCEDAGVDAGDVCTDAADSEPCATEGQICGGCTDRCTFCNILRCERGNWTLSRSSRTRAATTPASRMQAPWMQARRTLGPAAILPCRPCAAPAYRAAIRVVFQGANTSASQRVPLARPGALVAASRGLDRAIGL
jgi:hypothetical protein